MNWVGFYTLVRREVMRFLRVLVQTLLSPWISAVLFIFIFGQVVGGQIGIIEGVPCIEFVLPGILMMNVLTSAFSHSSSSLYFQRFALHIEEVLVVGLWAKGFEQLSILATFVLTPLSFLGGMFNSINMLPEALQVATRFNPIYYFNDACGIV
jgi:ABC-type polysaccharide/polyol phosphate export permease